MTREEILQAFDDINFAYNDCTRYDTLKRMLEELTERKRGEWKICDAKPPTWWYECSVCGNAGNIEYNYCPNCGADMRGGNNDGR